MSELSALSEEFSEEAELSEDELSVSDELSEFSEFSELLHPQSERAERENIPASNKVSDFFIEQHSFHRNIYKYNSITFFMCCQ